MANVISCIYSISLKDEKYYIGSTKNYHRRKSQHINKLKAGKHTNKELQHSFNKTKQFSMFVLEITNDLSNREQYWLNKFWPNCYNSSPKAWNCLANPDNVKKALATKLRKGIILLTDSDVKEIKNLLIRSTLSDLAIAKLYGVSRHTIVDIRLGRRRQNVYVEGFEPFKRNNTYSKEQIKYIKTLLFKKGYSVTEVSNLLNIPKSTISTINCGRTWAEVEV